MKYFLGCSQLSENRKEAMSFRDSLYPTRIRAVFDMFTKDGLTHLREEA